MRDSLKMMQCVIQFSFISSLFALYTPSELFYCKCKHLSNGCCFTWTCEHKHGKLKLNDFLISGLFLMFFYGGKEQERADTVCAAWSQVVFAHYESSADFFLIKSMWVCSATLQRDAPDRGSEESFYWRSLSQMHRHVEMEEKLRWES